MLSLRIFLFALASVLLVAASQAADKPAKVVFVCEHGAAKSIVAAAYFNHLAKERGINAEAVARGINLDPEIAPVASDNLKKEGLAPGEAKPTALSQSDVDGAVRVISMCELPEKFAKNAKVTSWTDIPPLGTDYAKARKVFLTHLGVLLDGLVAPRAAQPNSAAKQ